MTIKKSSFHLHSALSTIAVGFFAGAVGSLTQSVFFKLTSKITPESPKDAFQPPELAQKKESALETVARRTIEGLMQRGPLSSTQKTRAGMAVHFLFGAAWGSLYGVYKLNTSSVHVKKDEDSRLAELRSVALFSTAVWMISDNFILPVFKLSAWPKAYRLPIHLYAWIAHLAYGTGVWGVFRVRSEMLSQPFQFQLPFRLSDWHLPHPTARMAYWQDSPEMENWASP